MKVISTDQAPEAIGPYSQAVKVGNMIYTSGQIPLKPDGELVEGDIYDQARQVLTNLQNVLLATGTDMENVVKTTIYLANMDDFVSVNTVYAQFFTKHLPARSTIAVKTLPLNVSIEIEAIAIIDSDEYSY